MNSLADKEPDRCALLNARSGSIAGKQLVMPIDLTYDEIARVSPKISYRACKTKALQHTIHLRGFVDEDSGCKAVLVIVPKVYLGWYNEIRANYIAFNVGGKGVDVDAKKAWIATRESFLRDYQISSVEDIISKLDAMYFAEKPRSLLKLQSVLEGLTELERNEMRMEKARNDIKFKRED